MPCKGYKQKEEHRKNLSKSKKGKMPKNIFLLHSPEIRKKAGISCGGEKCYMWKGEKAGYRAKHNWIVKYYGQPITCEHCQTGNLFGHKIHWANISGKFLRLRLDWLRLCAKCHNLFDKQKKQWQITKKQNKK